MRKKYVKKLLLAVLSTLLISTVAGCDTGKAAVPTESDSDAKKISDIKTKVSNSMINFAKNTHFSGYALIAKNGQVVFENGYGYADYGAKLPNTRSTKFRINVITKQFTAMGIMMLQEKGLLNVNDTINKYIPDYPQGEKITISELLTNTSGITSYTNFIFNNNDKDTGSNTDTKKFEIKEPYTPENIIASFKGLPLLFKPGEKLSSSDSDDVLLGYIIEKVSGLKYENFLEKNIFIPLKMNNTGCDIENVKNMAIGYSRADSTDLDNPVAAKASLYYKVAYSAGEVYSTAEDLIKWSDALYKNSLVKDETFKKIFECFAKDNLSPYGYGYGWLFKTEAPHKTLMGATTPGFHSEIYRDIDCKSTIIFLSNNESNGISDVINDALKTK